MRGNSGVGGGCNCRRSACLRRQDVLLPGCGCRAGVLRSCRWRNVGLCRVHTCGSADGGSGVRACEPRGQTCSSGWISLLRLSETPCTCATLRLVCALSTPKMHCNTHALSLSLSSLSSTHTHTLSLIPTHHSLTPSLPPSLCVRVYMCHMYIQCGMSCEWQYRALARL